MPGRKKGKPEQNAAFVGVMDVYQPVLFSVITTMVAFLPLLFLPGPEGMLIKAVPIVVITTLVFSLFESLAILPAHLSKQHFRQQRPHRVQRLFNYLMQQLIQRGYMPLLRLTMRNPLAVNCRLQYRLCTDLNADWAGLD